MSNNINTISMLKVGTILHGTYRIDGYLSSGGFGNTYVATNTAFDERFAIKEFFMRGISERDSNNTTVSVSNVENEATFAAQKEKFKKEAKRLHNLHSEHIVHVYDLFEENGTAYYVMDYIDGENLSMRLKRIGKPLTEEEVLHILSQILEALDTAHNYRDGDKQGILHLDLKPANIMVDKHGVVKLIDFGASKQQSASGGATTSSAISYTQGYAPREQMEQNLDKFGPWTDFYALGATLYTMLTNKKPPMPSDIDDDETPDKHQSLLMPPYISQKTKHLVLWLMKTNRKERPQSVAAIIDYLTNKGNSPTFYNNNAASKDKPLKEDDETLVKGSKRTDGEGETLVIGKDEPKKKVKDVHNNPKTYVSPIPDVNDNSKARKAIPIIIAVLVVIFIITISTRGCGGNRNQSAAPATDSDAVAWDSTYADTAAADTAMAETYVNQVQCNVMQGTCTYTGYVNEDGVPNGDGEAWFNDGRYYKGYFANGMMADDDAFFRFSNGDTYQGSFVNDHFSNGRYTIAEDKSYFVGSYDDQGQPKSGAWYDKNGNKIQNV